MNSEHETAGMYSPSCLWQRKDKGFSGQYHNPRQGVGRCISAHVEHVQTGPPRPYHGNVNLTSEGLACSLTP